MRATLVAGLASVAVAAAAVAPVGVAEAAAPPTMTGISYPVIATRVAVWVALPTGKVATIRRVGGAAIESSTSVGGHVLLTVNQAAGARVDYQVTAPGYAALSVWSNSSPTALAASPWRMVNKRNSLSRIFVPAGLTWIEGHQMTAAAAKAMRALLAGAAAAGFKSSINSAYRSWSAQQALYNQDERLYGPVVADDLVARPGFSEHQLGLAADLSGASCTNAACTQTTPTGRWIAANAWRYGFELSNEPGQTPVSGWQPEPWHVRYLADGLAAYMYARGIKNLEVLFGMPAAPNYS